MNDSVIEYLLVNLKVLGDVEENGRISVIGNNLALESDAPYQGVKRWLTGDSRQLDFRRINAIVVQVVDYARMLTSNVMLIQQKGSTANAYDEDKYHSSLMDLDVLAENLENSTKGIYNLTKTYRSDRTTVAQLNVLNDRIKVEVNKMKNFIKRNKDRPIGVGPPTVTRTNSMVTSAAAPSTITTSNNTPASPVPFPSATSDSDSDDDENVSSLF